MLTISEDAPDACSSAAKKAPGAVDRVPSEPCKLRERWVVAAVWAGVRDGRARSRAFYGAARTTVERAGGCGPLREARTDPGCAAHAKLPPVRVEPPEVRRASVGPGPFAGTLPNWEQSGVG